MEAEVAAVIRVGLKDIVKEIQDFKTELKMQFITFKEEIKKEMKEELENFEKDINQRLTETTTTTELATQTTRITETYKTGRQRQKKLYFGLYSNREYYKIC